MTRIPTILFAASLCACVPDLTLDAGKVFLSCTSDEDCLNDDVCAASKVCVSRDSNARPVVGLGSVARRSDYVLVPIELSDEEGGLLSITTLSLANIEGSAAPQDEDFKTIDTTNYALLAEDLAELEANAFFGGAVVTNRYFIRIDAQTIFGDSNFRRLALRMAVVDDASPEPQPSAVAQSEVFEFGNDAPFLSEFRLSPPDASSRVTLSFNLRDGNRFDNLLFGNDDIDIVEIRAIPDGGEAVVVFPETAGAFPAEQTQALGSSFPNGQFTAVQWRSDLSTGVNALNGSLVGLEIDVIDTLGAVHEGIASENQAYFDFVNDPPTITFTEDFPQDEAYRAAVGIKYILSDPNEGDNAVVEGQYCLNPDSEPPYCDDDDWQTITAADIGATALDGASAREITDVWNTPAEGIDFEDTLVSAIRIRLRATDVNDAQKQGPWEFSEIFAVNNSEGNTPPSVQFIATPRSIDTCEIVLKLFDLDAETALPIALTISEISYDLQDGNGPQPANIDHAGSFAAHKEGIEHSFSWYLPTDFEPNPGDSDRLETTFFSDVRLTVTLSDGTSSMAFTSSQFELGNNPPIISNVEIEVNEMPNYIRGNTILRFTASDSNSDPINLRRFEFEVCPDLDQDPGTNGPCVWQDVANAVAIPTGVPGLPIPVGAVEQLPTNPTPSQFSFVWDTRVPLDERSTGRARLTIEDWVSALPAAQAFSETTTADGQPNETFQIRNQNFAPEVVGALNVEANSGNETVTLRMNLRDLDADPLSLRVQYDVGEGYKDIASNSPLSDLISDPSPAGIETTVVWDARQLGPGIYNTIMLRVQLFDTEDRTLSPEVFGTVSTITINSGNALPNPVFKEIYDPSFQRPLQDIVVEGTVSDGDSHEVGVELYFDDACDGSSALGMTLNSLSADPTGLPITFTGWAPSTVRDHEILDANSVPRTVFESTSICFSMLATDELGDTFTSPESGTIQVGNSLPSLELLQRQFNDKGYSRCGEIALISFIPIFFALSDPDSDIQSLEMEFREYVDNPTGTPSENPWQATVLAGSFLSSTQPQLNAVQWEIGADWPTVDTRYEIRLRATEAFNALTFASAWDENLIATGASPLDPKNTILLRGTGGCGL